MPPLHGLRVLRGFSSVSSASLHIRLAIIARLRRLVSTTFRYDPFLVFNLYMCVMCVSCVISVSSYQPTVNRNNFSLFTFNFSFTMCVSCVKTLCPLRNPLASFAVRYSFSYRKERKNSTQRTPIAFLFSPTIIWRFTCNCHIVRMALRYPGICDACELGVV